MAKISNSSYSYIAVGKAGRRVIRTIDGADLGIAVKVNRLGGGHMWHATPPGHNVGDSRSLYRPTYLEAARYLDALARIEAAGVQVGDRVTYDTGEGFDQTETVTEINRFGVITVTGVLICARIHMRDIALAMIKNDLDQL